MGDREAYAAAARGRADALYRGEVTAHRSCGIALAETFGLSSPPYQALRRGGILGEGPCGAIQAGVLVLGELLGDPDPSGAVTPVLREAVTRYRAAIAAKVDHAVDTACNTRTSGFPLFTDPARAGYCTQLAALCAETVAEVLWDLDRVVLLPEPPWRGA